MLYLAISTHGPLAKHSWAHIITANSTTTYYITSPGRTKQGWAQSSKKLEGLIFSAKLKEQGHWGSVGVTALVSWHLWLHLHKTLAWAKEYFLYTVNVFVRYQVFFLSSDISRLCGLSSNISKESQIEAWSKIRTVSGPAQRYMNYFKAQPSLVLMDKTLEKECKN